MNDIFLEQLEKGQNGNHSSSRNNNSPNPSQQDSLHPEANTYTRARDSSQHNWIHPIIRVPYQEPPSYPPNLQINAYPNFNSRTIILPKAPSSFSLTPSQISGAKVTKESTFRDWWAAVTFLGFLGLYIYVGVIFIPNINNIAFPDDPPKLVTNRTILTMSLVLSFSYISSIAYLVLIHMFTKFTMILSFWFFVVSMSGFGSYLLATKSYVSGSIFLSVGVLFSFSWFVFKKAIPFTEAILKAVLKIARKFPSAFVAALLFGLILFAVNLICYIFLISAPKYMKIYSSCAHTTHKRGIPVKPCNNPKLVAMYIYIVFFYFWVSQVIINVLNTTISGLFASYYFYEGSPEGYPTKYTLLSSLKRASIFSFGSVCFGSLLVPVVQFFRLILSYIRAGDSNNVFTTMLNICAQSMLAFSDGMLEYFNRYAYIEIAIYGKPFMKAAKDTWSLVKIKGVTSIINDSLVSNIINMAGFTTGLVCGIAKYYLSIALIPPIGSILSKPLLLAAIGFIYGTLVFSLVNNIITAGASTTFVCLAEDPEVFMRTEPELYELMVSKYPDFVTHN